MEKESKGQWFFQVYRKLEDEELLQAWKILESKADSPVSWGYYEALKWWTHYGRDFSQNGVFKKELLVIAAFRSGLPKAILPLVRVFRRKTWFPPTSALEMLGSGLGWFALDLIHNELETQEAIKFYGFIRRKINCHYQFLFPLPEGSVLRKISGKTFFHSARMFISLASDYPLTRKLEYSAHFRRTLNNYRNKVEALGERLEEMIFCDPQAFHTHLEAIRILSLDKEVRKGKTSPYSQEASALFLKSILTSQPGFFMAALFLDKKLVAYVLGFEKSGRVHAIDSAFCRETASKNRIGLGAWVMDLVVRNYSGKADSIDLGLGLDDYKFGFTRRFEKTYALVVPGKGWWIRPSYWWIRLRTFFAEKKALKRLQKHVRPPSNMREKEDD